MIKKKVLNNKTKLLPIASVDLLISVGNKYLLAKRNNFPAKNKYAFIGGIIQKKETIINCCNRILKRELNVVTKNVLRLVTVKKFTFTNDFFGKRNLLEYVSIVYSLKLSKKEFNSIKLNNEHNNIILNTKNDIKKNKKVINQIKELFKNDL